MGVRQVGSKREKIPYYLYYDERTKVFIENLYCINKLTSYDTSILLSLEKTMRLKKVFKFNFINKKCLKEDKIEPTNKSSIN